MSLEVKSREELRELSDNLHYDVIAQRYLQRLKQTNSFGIATPEDAIGQRMLIVARLLREGTDDNVTRAADGATNEDRWTTLTCLSILVLDSVPHVWADIAWDKAWELEIPRHVISPRALPIPFMWHTFERARGTDEHQLLGILINDGGVEISVTEFQLLAPDDKNASVIYVDKLGIPYGATWPDEFEDADERVGNTLQLLAFLASPYIPRSQERMGRGARREMARRGSEANAEDEVTFVLLRRTSEKRERAETEMEVQWRHRWIVSGHLRAQWYPSEQAHHLIWIAPYMKGPEDAPMLEHVYRVAR